MKNILTMVKQHHVTEEKWFLKLLKRNILLTFRWLFKEVRTIKAIRPLQIIYHFARIKKIRWCEDVKEFITIVLLETAMKSKCFFSIRRFTHTQKIRKRNQSINAQINAKFLLSKFTLLLENLIIYYLWKNLKKVGKTNKFKLAEPTWYKKFELPDGWCFVSEIKDYFEYTKKNYTFTNNPTIQICINYLLLGSKEKQMYLSYRLQISRICIHFYQTSPEFYRLCHILKYGLLTKIISH